MFDELESENPWLAPAAYYYVFKKPGRTTAYASVHDNEWREGISDEEWRTRQVVPLFTAPTAEEPTL